MSFTDEQLKGNWGEQYVSEWLSSCGCLMRHVPQGHDCGIDIYCETTYDGKPFLHIWCQVKVSGKFNSDAESNSVSIDREKLEYWRSLPVPVVVVLVPDKRGERPPLFVCAPQIVMRQGPTLKSTHKIDDASQMKKFLADDLPYETFLWELFHGKVSPIKEPRPSYTRRIPPGVAHEFENNLRLSLLHTLWRLGEDILYQSFGVKTLQPKTNDEASQKEAIKTAKPYIQALEAIVQGINIGNYENFVTIGILAELEGDFDKAKAFYEMALSSIDGDVNLPRLLPDDWQAIRDMISDHLQRVNHKKGEYLAL
ncbi:MAG: DUF4365 domain-containing protein [Acidobacteria bacterium]|nr:DUF4365 domain-containing protein [Acidobacteriota bacterium]MBI3656755.1 DUF4365 domain-containing protein [Acidobacteriota bacterium]